MLVKLPFLILQWFIVRSEVWVTLGKMADGEEGIVVETFSVLEFWAIFEFEALGI